MGRTYGRRTFIGCCIFSTVTIHMLSRFFSPLLKPFRSLTLGGHPDLQKSNWKKDVVYLFQFKRSPVIPNLSPFCIKIETFLRAHDIPYEPIGSWTTRSKQGRVPFIELNGEQIADSQIIIWHLIKHFNIDEGLSKEQKALSRAVERLAEGSIYYPITYFRSIEGARNSANPNVSGAPIPSFLIGYFANKISSNATARLNSEGIGKMPRDVIIEILRKDIEAVDGLLGDKKFIIGAKPTVADFTVFGHLGVGYFLPFRQPVQDILNDEFPRVRGLLERIRLHYWPDWAQGSKEE
uniref:GST N-terminal domain-containing protein n=1 Tax=Bursaphelenchus xylophilus TaxID=6326 RepID=A0A1I7RLN6_BURXY